MSSSCYYYSHTVTIPRSCVQLSLHCIDLCNAELVTKFENSPSNAEFPILHIIKIKQLNKRNNKIRWKKWQESVSSITKFNEYVDSSLLLTRIFLTNLRIDNNYE